MLHTVSVVIPARNEASTIEAIVRPLVALARDGRGAQLHEVIVVDDGSTDDTAAVAAAAGAMVIDATDGPGKGAAMWNGVAEATGDIVVFCDADLEEFDPRFVTRLADGLRAAGDQFVLVKADYERAGEGGRVTELAARPVLQLLHPHLAHISQPLGGEYAATRAALEQVPFVRGYGVEMGLLIDLSRRFGVEAVGQVDLGVRRHRNRPLSALGPQAREVLSVALARAGVAGISVEELPPLAHRRRPRRLA